MVTERQAALASAVPRESEFRPRLRLVALFPNAFDGELFACEFIGTAAQAASPSDRRWPRARVRGAPPSPFAPASPTHPDACLRAAARCAAPRPASLRGGATAAARPGGRGGAEPWRVAAARRRPLAGLPGGSRPAPSRDGGVRGRVAWRRRPGRGVTRGERRRRPWPPRLPRVPQRRGGAPPPVPTPPSRRSPEPRPLRSPPQVCRLRRPTLRTRGGHCTISGVGAKESSRRCCGPPPPRCARPAPRCIPHPPCARRAQADRFGRRR